ncbi:LysR family transcriptional regulator [Pseudomonas oryzihabitans]|nr:LysR family transcriptional regulator [Pseudomonas psychrotolerans]KTT34944.1 LysR family transcriptional regulator [Pseudomonas psychrotolerans]KTT40584.1 LysR family transcriptional regulator [Pseudomonas psychrotolerans]KTT42700.1 LysR family transcriptional regulator [Pseudomonas psychrotolerans]
MIQTHHRGPRMSRLPPLYALRAFESASRQLSFTRAAQELNITQSAVSRHIKTLEQDLGCLLFERRGPSLKLTPTGLILAKDLSSAFADMQGVCDLVRSGRGCLRLKAPSTLTMRWLMAAIEAYRVATGENRVQLTSVWMDIDFVDFRSEPYDCAVILADGEFTSDCASVRLFDEWLVPVCAPRYQRACGGEDPIFGGDGLLHASHDCRDWRLWLDRIGRLAEVNWHAGKRFETLDAGISAAVQGFGVAIGDLSLVQAQIASGQLVFANRTVVRSGLSYYLVWPRRSEAHEVLAGLRDHLGAVAPVLPRPEGLTFIE